MGTAGAPVLGSVIAAQDAFAETLHGLDLPAYTAATFPRLRDEYLLSPEVSYLNHASIGTIPRAVQVARQQYLDACETNPWLHMWGGAWEEPHEAVRAEAAALINAEANHVAFLHNTTEAFSLLANGLPLGPGDEVVFSTLTHAGASIAFDHLASVRGFSVTRFDFPLLDVATMSVDDILSLYDPHLTANTKLLVLPHIDNTVGLRHPIRELAQLARAKGVDFIAVDAAQTVGMIPVDMAALGVDVFATSPHKWLQAPKGLGLSYFSPAIQDVLRPMWMTWGQAQWDHARRYEDYGTRNLAEVLTLGDAMAFQSQLHAAEREQRLRDLWTFTRSLAEENPQTAWRSPTTWALGGSLYAIEVPGNSSQLAKQLFAEHGLVFRPFTINGVHTVRLSPNVFTTEDEIARFFELATL